MPKFSIVVPGYNVAPYLRECLDSVLHQTFTDWECLCVNDGSKDESGAIFDEYARKDKRFRAFHQPNSGVSVARNVALKNAQGKYLLFLDSDDILSLSLFQRLEEIILKFNPDALRYESLAFKDIATLTSLRAENDSKVSLYNLADVTQAKEWFRVGFTNYIWKMCYKRSLISNINFVKIPYLEDGLYNFECFGTLRTCALIHSKLHFYRLRPNSVTKSITLTHLKSVLTSLQMSFQASKNWGNIKFLKPIVYKNIWRELGGYCWAIVDNLDVRDKKEGQKVYFNALAWFYHQKDFHHSPFIQKIYCFFGFFSWRFVAFFFLRLPLLVKGKIVKLLMKLGVKR